MTIAFAQIAFCNMPRGEISAHGLRSLQAQFLSKGIIDMGFLTSPLFCHPVIWKEIILSEQAWAPAD